MANISGKRSALIILGTLLSVAGALSVILSGYGYQWGWWNFGTGFSMIPWGTGAAVIGGILAGIGYFRKENRFQNEKIAAAMAMLLALVALVNIGYWFLQVQQGYPPIHDISTDTLNPPEFDAIVPLRADAPNPPEYIREDGVAAAQKAFYSDIETLMVPLEYDAAYDRALAIARDMPWQIVGENKAEGRIEAYHKLPWYGFIDDVVIRVDTAETGSKVDVRSKSRIGRGDLGENANRIREYLEAYQN